MQSPIIRDMFPALVDAAHTIGAVQTRNLGTLGGNLVTAVPSVDSGPTLVALDALVTMLSVPAASGRCRSPISSSVPARPRSSPRSCWSTSSSRREPRQADAAS